MTFPVLPPATGTLVLVAVLILALLALGAYLLFMPAPAMAVVIRGAGVLVLAIAALFGVFLFGASRMTLTVTETELRLKAPMYGSSAPLELVDASGVRAVNLDTETALRPTVRSNGLGLPGYLLGWFRVPQGAGGAASGSMLVAVTDRSRVVFIPLADGSAWMLNVDDGKGVVAQLKNP